jgi:hypothetical protein
MCDAGLFFVTLDPVGKHWALRAGADGSEQGGKKDVWVFGGAHGDLPLEPAAGELIADTSSNTPAVTSLTSPGSRLTPSRTASRWRSRNGCSAARPGTPGFPLLVILEEAESFIPERPQQGQQPMLGAFGRIMRQGRNHGLGMWMVAQRAQALNKGVLSQAEVLVVKQMAHPRDRDAVDAWVKANGTQEQREELMGSLAALDQKDAWVWSPAWLRAFKQARVLERTTFDSSASVRSNVAQQAVQLQPLDVDALGEKMDDVGPLVAAAQEARNLVRQALDGGAQVIKDRELEERHEQLIAQEQKLDEQRQQKALRRQEERDREPSTPRATPAREKREIDDGELTTAQRELLGTYIALHPRPVAAPQLGIILAKSHSAGPFRGAINALRDKGYIEPADGGDVAVGKALEMTPLEVPSAAAVQQRWRDRLKGVAGVDPRPRNQRLSGDDHTRGSRPGDRQEPQRRSHPRDLQQACRAPAPDVRPSGGIAGVGLPFQSDRGPVSFVALRKGKSDDDPHVGSLSLKGGGTPDQPVPAAEVNE